MKVLFVNLPYPVRLTRRYMCTYVSATTMYPPYELMSVAGVVRANENYQIDFLDCVAEGLNEEVLFNHIEKNQPDVVLSLIGVDTFERDISIVNQMKVLFPSKMQVIFGHYPTLFTDEILQQSKVDIIIKGEPDIIMLELLDALRSHFDLNEIAGIGFRKHDGTICQSISKKRIANINSLPLPVHDLIDTSKYFEAFLPLPFGMIQTSRGCPFSCNFCVTTFGSLYVVKSPAQVLSELKIMISVQNIRSFRIIDDTFTIQKQRVIDICNLMIKEELNLKWTCLSRVDTINKTMLFKMKEAGCVRICFGIESGSQKVLDDYNKEFSVDNAKEVIEWCTEIGIETVGLFMTGLPNETEKDFQETLDFAKKSSLTFAGVGELTPYPGTDLFEIYKDQIEFNLFPYVLRFKDKSLSSNAIKRRSIFHKKFYWNFNRLMNIFIVALKNPKSLFLLIKNLYTARKYGTIFYPYLHE